MTLTPHAALNLLRNAKGAQQSVGIADALLQPFLLEDADLSQALSRAVVAQQQWQQKFDDGEVPDFFKMPEADAIVLLQQGWLNFYPATSSTPFIPLAAQGPWVISAHGGVFLDVGGYGKDPLGHHPQALQAVLNEPQVMMNVMTAQPSHWRLHQVVAQALGIAPQTFKLQMLNSGSEGVELALTYVERRMQQLASSTTSSWLINLHGSFHGRTARPARVSDSTKSAYQNAGLDRRTPYEIKTITMNDNTALQQIFAQAAQQGAQIVGMIIEMVQGEGNPGAAVTPEFYQQASALCQQAQAVLIVDSVQAGWRAYGTLSPLSDPAFQQLPRPAIEVLSKAIHGGIYPCSLIVIDQSIADSFARGTYGNTMTANPKACDLIIRMCELMTPTLQANLHARSAQWFAGLQQLQQQFPQLIEKVQGTGLLLAIKIARRQSELVIPVMGASGLERACRMAGLNIIHGGKDDCLRLTPAFNFNVGQVTLALQLITTVFAQAVATRT
jgi:4-aminobutyrate aminotransferase-like enzyme